MRPARGDIEDGAFIVSLLLAFAVSLISTEWVSWPVALGIGALAALTSVVALGALLLWGER